MWTVSPRSTMGHVFPCSVLAVLSVPLLVQFAETQNLTRDARLVSLFQIVRFPNAPCIGSASKNGTCYTADECSKNGGSSAGSCASGYGVCCTFTLNCGSTLAENCTYFESTGGEVGACQATICPCSDNICQLRLDFDQFVISGPSTLSLALDAVTKLTKGQPNPLGLLSYTAAGQCLTDTFTATDPGGCSPPSICGINTGEHMYLDSHDSCNDLLFQLGQRGVGAGVASRQWSIKDNCCNYGASAMGYDCVMIPGARKSTDTLVMAAVAICGNGQGLRAGLSSLNELTVHAVAMETWRAFHSQDGPDGSRNALGQVLFPSNVATRSTRSETAGVVSPHLPYAANTLGEAKPPNVLRVPSGPSLDVKALCGVLSRLHLIVVVMVKRWLMESDIDSDPPRSRTALRFGIETLKSTFIELKSAGDCLLEMDLTESELIRLERYLVNEERRYQSMVANVMEHLDSREDEDTTVFPQETKSFVISNGRSINVWARPELRMMLRSEP
eukprot:maker-scaffold279_size225217-snap-gene-1.24 protein:Tk08922 transcript:maker-scaffold279_size225217-snap-gene-1.24-mRNA-1 annotation:"hypothetical protein DAPPUDRAFT_311633"